MLKRRHDKEKRCRPARSFAIFDEENGSFKYVMRKLAASGLNVYEPLDEDESESEENQSPPVLNYGTLQS